MRPLKLHHTVIFFLICDQMPESFISNCECKNREPLTWWFGLTQSSAFGNKTTESRCSCSVQQLDLCQTWKLIFVDVSRHSKVKTPTMPLTEVFIWASSVWVSVTTITVSPFQRLSLLLSILFLDATTPKKKQHTAVTSPSTLKVHYVVLWRNFNQNDWIMPIQSKLTKWP